MKTTLRLPTAATFAKWPLIKRTRLFARWLAAQPKRKTYVYVNGHNCVLGQFAQAIFRSGPDPTGMFNDIYPDSPYATGAEEARIVVFEGVQLDRALQVQSRTFGAASRAFNVAFKEVA